MGEGQLPAEAVQFGRCPVEHAEQTGETRDKPLMWTINWPCLVRINAR